MKKDLKISSSTFTSFFSWYSWPNVVWVVVRLHVAIGSFWWIRMAAVGGVLIDKWIGIVRGATIFSGVVVVGQIMFGLGGFFRLIWLMNMGRFILGLGGESLSTAQSAYTVAWFSKEQLNFIFGLQVSLARVVRVPTLFAFEDITKYRWCYVFLKASLIGVNTIRPIYDSFNGHISGPKHIGVTLLIGVSACIFSLGCAFVLWWLDNRRLRLKCEDNSNDAGSLSFLSTHPGIRFYLFFSRWIPPSR